MSGWPNRVGTGAIVVSVSLAVAATTCRKAASSAPYNVSEWEGSLLIKRNLR